MGKVVSSVIIGIIVLGLIGFSENAFAEKKSVFNGISDAIKYPFHSAAKAVGWDGTPSKFSGQKELVKSIPTLPVWLCEISFNVWQNFYKDDLSILLNLINSCSSNSAFAEKISSYLR